MYGAVNNGWRGQTLAFASELNDGGRLWFIKTCADRWPTFATMPLANVGLMPDVPRRVHPRVLFPTFPTTHASHSSSLISFAAARCTMTASSTSPHFHVRPFISR